MRDFALQDYVAGVFIMARWPQLVLSQFCTTDIKVTVEGEELNENGTPCTLIEWSGKCNYQDKAKRIYTGEKTLVEVTGTCLIPGDIAPEVATIPSGIVHIFGVDRILVLGTKARNPDGTVNFTQLELK